MNGAYQDDSDIGKLMHDFACANPDDMKYRILAEKTRYYKKDEEGVKKMSPVIEEYAAEIAAEERENAYKKIAMNLLKMGKMTYNEIATASELSESKVRELAEHLQVGAK